jgi:2-amino-4-hydroxy-6-hydroxymethyldihydropteridine diphosphokinase
VPRIYLGLGSNLQPAKNLKLAVSELARRFSLVAVSAVYRNAAVGFVGDDFLNAVAAIETDLSPTAVCRELEAIHDLAGRIRGTDAFVSRTLDVDLLLYGDEILESPSVPRSDILQYSFVLRPLAEIAPDLVHPLSGKTMARHWAEFDTDSHHLTRDSLVLSTPAQESENRRQVTGTARPIGDN